MSAALIVDDKLIVGDELIVDDKSIVEAESIVGRTKNNAIQNKAANSRDDDDEPMDIIKMKMAPGTIWSGSVYVPKQEAMENV
jgi:hypothetical protein